MKHLYFIRHGESVRNAQRVFAGQFNTPLTERGREEAKQTGQQLQGMHFDTIVSSPLSRALETAQIVAERIGYPSDQIITNDLFKERSLGTLEGKSWDEYDEQADKDNGAETEAELLARAQQGLAFLQSLPGDTILLVGHGSLSRALRTAIDPTQSYGEPENAQVVQLI